MDAPSSSSSGGSKFLQWAVIGTTATVAVAGIGYLAYSLWNDAEAEEEAGPSTSQKDMENAARLRIAKGIQMQTLAGGPARVAPKRTAAPAAAAASSKPSLPQRPAANSKAGGKPAGSGSRKCANCSQPCSGLPLRCSGCKQVYYCSQDCQKKAWPEHKAVCKTSAAANKGASGSDGGSSSASTPAPSATPAEKAEAGSGATAGEAGEEPKSFQEALAMYLEQNAAQKADELEGLFELAVMLFVKGEYRKALEQLAKVQAMAKEKGNPGVEGEVFKWMGHTHNKLAERDRARELFTQGAAFAKEHKLQRLEIDCVAGLGCMHRASGESAKAVELLQRALELCTEAGDEDSRASTLCNLGSAMISIEPDKALMHLHEAVDIRERAIEALSAANERSGLATAVMEHANALVNLASALYVVSRHEQAKLCYERALEVFELIEDVDKVSKVLINLANLCELQLATVAARREAAEFRKRLVAFLAAHGVRRLDSECAICLEPMAMQEPTTTEGQELVLLSCIHCMHNKCWQKWIETHQQGNTADCPTCKQPVPLFGTGDA